MLILNRLSLHYIILFGIFFRLLTYFYFIYNPLYHSEFGEIGSLVFQYFNDYPFYYNFGEEVILISGNLNKAIIDTYLSLLTFNLDNVSARIPGFVFPFILYLHQYSENNVLYLSISTFIIEMFLMILWCYYFKYKKLHNLYIIIFILLPIPFIFAFIHSPDVWFFLLTSLIILKYEKFIKVNNFFLLLICFLIVSTKPHGIVLVGLIFMEKIINIKKKNYIFILICFLILVYSFFYYFPYYYLEFLRINSDIYKSKFAINFNENLFIHYMYKLFYLLGGNPGGSGLSIIIISRNICAMIFLIGFINMILSGNYNLIFLYILISIILIVLLFYPAYRYSINFVPILFLNFCIALNKLLSLFTYVRK